MRLDIQQRVFVDAGLMFERGGDTRVFPNVFDLPNGEYVIVRTGKVGECVKEDGTKLEPQR